MAKTNKKKEEDREKVESKIAICFINYESCMQRMIELNIKPSFFNPGIYRALYSVCLKHYKEYNQLITKGVFKDKLSKPGKFSKFEISSIYNQFNLLSKSSKLVSETDVDYYVDRLKSFYASDVMLGVVEEYVQGKRDGKDDIEQLDELHQKLSQKKEEITEESNISLYFTSQMEENLKQDVVNRINNPELYRGIFCGIPEMDQLLGSRGLLPGELTLFMAEPGGGKTSMMITVADAIWRYSRRNILYVSLEMSAEQIGYKHLCCHTNLDYSVFMTGQLKHDGASKSIIDEAFEQRRELADNGVRFAYLDVASSGKMRTSSMEFRIKNMISSFKPDVVLVDYLDLLRPEMDRPGDHHIELGDICKYLRGMGKKLDFSVISAVQLKRSAIERIRKTGNDDKISFGTDDVSGSHSISADADRIYALMIDKQTRQKMRIYTAKNRYGDLSNVQTLNFNGGASRIYSDIENNNSLETNVLEPCDETAFDIEDDD